MVKSQIKIFTTYLKNVNFILNSVTISFFSLRNLFPVRWSHCSFYEKVKVKPKPQKSGKSQEYHRKLIFLINLKLKWATVCSTNL